jgi:hypothetical protein
MAPDIIALEAEALATRRVVVVGRTGGPLAITLAYHGELVRDFANAAPGSTLAAVRDQLEEPPPRDHYYLVLIDVTPNAAFAGAASAEGVRAAVLVVDLPPGDPRRRPAVS